MLAMTDKQTDVPALLERYRRQIQKRELPIEMLMKTETLQDSLETYRGKIAQAMKNVFGEHKEPVKW